MFWRALQARLVCYNSPRPDGHFPRLPMSITQSLKRSNNFLRRLFIASAVFLSLVFAGAVVADKACRLPSSRPPLRSSLPQLRPPTRRRTHKSRNRLRRSTRTRRLLLPEQVVETAIYYYGSRPLLSTIRRNGVERGRICKPSCEAGKVEEASYERRFVQRREHGSGQGATRSEDADVGVFAGLWQWSCLGHS